VAPPTPPDTEVSVAPPTPPDTGGTDTWRPISQLANPGDDDDGGDEEDLWR